MPDFHETIVSIVLVNYNGHQHIGSCLDSIFSDTGSPQFEVICVDNASTDESLSVLKQYEQKLPNLKIICSDFNRGYAGGINLGAACAGGEYIAVLNMDIRVHSGWLFPVVEFLENNPKAGSISPLMVLSDDNETINAIGQQVHVTALGFNRGLGMKTTNLDNQPIKVSGIHGGAFILRKSLFIEMGGMDEHGFLYHEDVDFSWLLLMMGYDLYCLPQSVVQHDYFLTMYPEKLYLLERNRLAMLQAHLEWRAKLTVLPLVLLTEALMWGYCFLRGSDFLKAKWASYRWLLKERLAIQQRKQFVRKLRQRSDWQVMRKLESGYAWRQFIILGRERGASARQPQDGMPVKIE